MDKEKQLIDELNEITGQIEKEPEKAEYQEKRVKKLFELASLHLFQPGEKYLEYLNLAFSYSQDNDYLFGIGKTNHLKGMREYSLMNYDKAIELYETALQYYDQVNAEVEIASLYNNLGLVFTGLTQYQQAIDNYKKSIVIFKKHQYISGLSNAYNNLGIVHKYMKNYRKARNYYLLDLELSQKTNNIQTMARAYNNLAGLYVQQKKYTEALDAVKKSAQYHKELNNFQALTNNLMIYSQLLFVNKNRKSCFRMLNKAQSYAKKYQNKRALITIYEMKSIFYQKDAQYKKANYYFKLYHQFYLEMFNQEKAQKLAELQALLEKRDTEKKAIMATAIAVSHEMRQPMMVLQANMEMLFIDLESKCTDEKTLKHQKKINESVQKLEEILEKLTNLEEVVYENYTDDVEMIKI